MEFVIWNRTQVELEVHQDNKIAVLCMVIQEHFKYLGDYQVFIIRDVNSDVNCGTL